jgi:hypothetical protein
VLGKEAWFLSQVLPVAAKTIRFVKIESFLISEHDLKACTFTFISIPHHTSLQIMNNISRPMQMHTVLTQALSS